MQRRHIAGHQMRHDLEQHDYQLFPQPQFKMGRDIFRQHPDADRRQQILRRSRHRQIPFPAPHAEKRQKQRVQRFSVYVHRDVLFGIVIDAHAVSRKHSQKKCQQARQNTPRTDRFLFQSYNLQYR